MFHLQLSEALPPDQPGLHSCPPRCPADFSPISTLLPPPMDVLSCCTECLGRVGADYMTRQAVERGRDMSYRLELRAARADVIDAPALLPRRAPSASTCLSRGPTASTADGGRAYPGVSPFSPTLTSLVHRHIYCSSRFNCRS